MPLKASELILNADQSIYHLNLLPEDLAPIVIVVGDQNRVARVSQHFDEIEVQKSRREFITHTGRLRGKRISVVSTGIGTDNIDIVLNELDALVNIDFTTKSIKEDITQLDIVRIGTSGAVQADIPIDSMVLSDYAIGFDNVLHFYHNKGLGNSEIERAFITHTQWPAHRSRPYVIAASTALADSLHSPGVIRGFTGTNTGFYGPQGRQLRLKLGDPQHNEKLTSFDYNGLKLTNLEMESSAIYGLSRLMGHRAASMNCILANRVTGEFSANPAAAVDRLIEYTLSKIVSI
ncbi:nucleoside phosphorylase [Lentiprolixibacter aurantiacus]|uniref:Uridine phosphorylase n=1 Tax=Lentiprolixibacter aurantiacus TaxID=2993939 RepID=A0AAE3SNZ1_9FLAO|nr:nucleoside phosphorylase [Lentiprolixibacter aurantiacus]MCX2719656.1 nucleoside phosphorylase [Lentiprolixibacter aurantiacus]